MGGDPVPLIRVAPLITIRLKGPFPSERSEPGIKLFSLDCENRSDRIKMKNIDLKIYIITIGLHK